MMIFQEDSNMTNEEIKDIMLNYNDLKASMPPMNLKR